ncbi:MAG: Ppx/GppA phosphatase family protein [Mycobacteriales bacterium]
MTRVGAVDCGTNSLRLLIADVAADGLHDVVREMRIVRLGEGVDRTGRLDPAALERTRVALAGYAALLREYEVRQVRMVATSATRDAANRDAFTAMVQEVLGVRPDVLTGAAEAALSFAGATRGMAGDLAEPVLVADIGGGSTELVLGTKAGGPSAASSVDVGCVRLTERHLIGDPPLPAEVARAVADVDAALEGAARVVPLDRASTLVGLAGSVTTVVAAALALAHYDAARIHEARIPTPDVLRACDRLLYATRAERAALGFMHPGRVDVIGGGALVLRRLVERLGLHELVVSEHDILDGIAWSVLEGQQRALAGKETGNG